MVNEAFSVSLPDGPTFQFKICPAKFAPGKRLVAIIDHNGKRFDPFAFCFGDGAERKIVVWKKKRGDGEKSFYEKIEALLYSLFAHGENGWAYSQGARLIVDDDDDDADNAPEPAPINLSELGGKPATATAPVEPTKRKRGRPRKKPAPAEPATATAPAESTKRKRGRPRKKPAPTETATVEPAKRKRGRPRKKPAPVEPVSVSGNPWDGLL